MFKLHSPHSVVINKQVHILWQSNTNNCPNHKQWCTSQILSTTKVSLRIMNHSCYQTNSNQPYAIILYEKTQIRKVINPYQVTKDNKPKIGHTKTQNQTIDGIDVNPWATDKEQKRFHDIKVEHDILRFKINTRINMSKCSEIFADGVIIFKIIC